MNNTLTFKKERFWEIHDRCFKQPVTGSHVIGKVTREPGDCFVQLATTRLSFRQMNEIVKFCETLMREEPVNPSTQE